MECLINAIYMYLVIESFICITNYINVNKVIFLWNSKLYLTSTGSVGPVIALPTADREVRGSNPTLYVNFSGHKK